MTHPVSLGGRDPHPDWYQPSGEGSGKRRPRVRRDAAHDEGRPAPANPGEEPDPPPPRPGADEGVGTQVDFEA
jgi:hypothetical protein